MGLLGRVWRRHRNTSSSTPCTEAVRGEFAQLQSYWTTEIGINTADQYDQEDSGSPINITTTEELPDEDRLGAGLQSPKEQRGKGGHQKAKRRLKGLLCRVWKQHNKTTTYAPCDSRRTEEEKEVRGELAQLQSIGEKLPAPGKMEDNTSSWLDPVLPFVQEDSGSSGSVLPPVELPEQDNLGAGLQPGGHQKAKRSHKGLRRWAWKRNQTPSSSTSSDSLRTEDKEEVRGELAQLQSMGEKLSAAGQMEDNISSWLDPVLPFVQEDSGSSGSVLPPVELPEQDNLGAGLQPGGHQKAKRSHKGLRRWAWKRNQTPSSSTSSDSLRTEDKEEVRGELAQLQSIGEKLPAPGKMEDNTSSWLDPVLPFVEEDSGSSRSVLPPVELPEQDNLGAGLQPGGHQKAKRSHKGLRRWAWKRNQTPSSSTSSDSLRTEDKEEVRGELAQLQSIGEKLPAPGKMKDNTSSWLDPVLPFVEAHSGCSRSVLPPVELPEQDNLGAGLQPGGHQKAKRSHKGLHHWARKEQHSPSSSTPRHSRRNKEEEEVRGELAQLQSIGEKLPAPGKMKYSISSWLDPVLPFVEARSGCSRSVLPPVELPEQDNLGAGLQPGKEQRGKGGHQKAKRSHKGLHHWAWEEQHSPSSSTPRHSRRNKEEEEVRGELAQLPRMVEVLPAAEAQKDSCKDPEVLFTKPSVRQPRHELTRALHQRHRVESLLQVREMSNKQLQDKNVALEKQKASWKEERKAYKEKVKALQEENAALQRKNTELQEELERRKAKEEDHLKKCAGAKAYIKAVMQQKVSDLQQELDHALRMQRISDSALELHRLLAKRLQENNKIFQKDLKASKKRIMELEEELKRRKAKKDFQRHKRASRTSAAGCGRRSTAPALPHPATR
ncbi:uncharacterized protein [Melanerpes formicivorus]|uniref:uncharacterized protein n=1 Tax=Melanerpes formicivorus TaxID=211600 RepID=UPI00358FECD1